MASESEMIRLYGKRAPHYDAYSKIFPLLGFRIEFYRRKAIAALDLKPGETVIDLACGTGLNFSHLQKAVGKEGRIIGVDICEAMLFEARKKIQENGWKNVELVKCDVAEYKFPKNVDGIISTYAITLVPQYDNVISRGAAALKPEKRFVILDFKKPEGWPDWFVRLTVRLFVAPFGGGLEMAERHPWESIEYNLTMVSFREFYFGAVYLVCGERTRL